MCTLSCCRRANSAGRCCPRSRRRPARSCPRRRRSTLRRWAPKRRAGCRLRTASPAPSGSRWRKVHLDMGVHLHVEPADGTSLRTQELAATKSGNMKGDFVLEKENVGKTKRRRSSRRISFVQRSSTESSAAVASDSMNRDQKRTAIQWYKKKRGIPRRHTQAKARNMTTTRHASG